MEYLRKVLTGEICLVKEDEKIIVFAYHQDVLDVLQKGLEEINVGFIRMDGQTASAIRSNLVDQFKTKPFIRVALLSIKVAGVGNIKYFYFILFFFFYLFFIYFYLFLFYFYFNLFFFFLLLYFILFIFFFLLLYFYKFRIKFDKCVCCDFC